jgi:hypothetical protein
VYGVLGALGLSWLAGVTALGAVTTLVAVLGAPTRPLPVIAPTLGAIVVAGLLPARSRLGAWWRLRRSGAGRPAPDAGGAGRTDRAAIVEAPSAGPDRPAGRWLGDVVCGVVALGVGVHTTAVTAALPVASTDEYAIWMIRARTLSQTGHLDAPVFLGDGAAYQHLDYPLFFPALGAWGDGWAGHPSDSAAHVAVAALVAALLAVVGWAANRLAGPLPAVAAVLLVASAPTMLSVQSLTLMSDVPLLAFALPLALALVCWLRAPDRRLLVAAAVLAAGACGTKVEGALFTGAAFLAALLVARGGRRGLLAAAGVAVVANLPWQVYARVHGLRSDVANSETLSAAHLRTVPRYAGQVVRGMADRWPWPHPVPGPVVLAAVALALLLAVRAGAGRIGAFLGIAAAVDIVVLAGQYVVSAGQNGRARPELAGLLQVTVYRVSLVPALLIMLAVPLLAGVALAEPRSARGDEVDRP